MEEEAKEWNLQGERKRRVSREQEEDMRRN
jgi:hypothetical protein